MSVSTLSCKRCGCIVLKAGVGVLLDQASDLMKDDGSVETVSSWISVRDMFAFENVAFSRDHKSLIAGERLLTCAGCEKGIFGKAVKHGDGPDAKMESLVDPTRLK